MLEKEFDNATEKLKQKLILINMLEMPSSDGMSFLLHQLGEIKIEIRTKETNHFTPHFHVSTKKFEASYTIEEPRILAGEVPRRYEKEIVGWAEENNNLLIKTWNNVHINKAIQ